jgi:hypothetical protein
LPLVIKTLWECVKIFRLGRLSGSGLGRLLTDGELVGVVCESCVDEKLTFFGAKALQVDPSGNVRGAQSD